MNTVLVTGADGFIASHLVPEIERETSWNICGIGLKPQASAQPGRLDYTVTDLTDYDSVAALLERCRPDGIFHLAAQPSVHRSWEDPWETYRINLVGQLNLMEAARKLHISPSMHIACSSEEYGIISEEMVPLSEQTPVSPCNHYAVSKVAQEELAQMYFRAFGWRTLISRGFNQAGPGQADGFVISSFAKQIASIEAGVQEPVISVGNLEARRDFTDVRDTVRAYRLLMENGKGGRVYNVCSGNAYRISDILDALLALTRVDIEIHHDPERQRPSDIPLVVGDNSLIAKEVGWAPAIPIETTLKDTLEYWRDCVNTAGGETN